MRRGTVYSEMADWSVCRVSERAGNGERGVKGMVLISTVVGGLFLYVIFERYLKRALLRTHDQRKAIEMSTLVAAIAAVGLAAGSLEQRQF